MTPSTATQAPPSDRVHAADDAEHGLDTATWGGDIQSRKEQIALAIFIAVPFLALAAAPGMLAPAIGRTPSRPIVPATGTGPLIQTPSGPMKRLVVAGGTSLSSGPMGGIAAASIRYVVGFAIMTGTAALTYRQCTRDSSFAIESSYRSKFLQASMELPGRGWRGDESLRESRTEGANWYRVEAFFRGGTADDPVEGLLVMRVHSPGMFPDEVDMDEFKSRIDQASRQIVASGPVKVPDLECTLDAQIRTEPAGSCRGTGTYRNETGEIFMVFWQDTVDDTMAVIYVVKGNPDDTIDAVKNFVTGITVE